jgi:hypothetical protein
LDLPVFADSVAVEAVYALGYYSTNFSGNNEVSALISNFADEERTYTVNFNVTGAETYSASQSVTVAAEDTTLVTFTGWLPSVQGLDTLSVSVNGLPMENVLDNNEAFYYTNVNPSFHGFADDAEKANSAGFGAGDGLILARHAMNGCGAVNAAEVFIDFSAEGDTLYAVLMDAMGNLIDSSDIFIPTAEEVNAYNSFYFPETPSFVDEEYYIGIAQVPTPGETYYPVGVQYETEYVRDSAYYRANIDGTMLTNTPLPGRLMIKAEIVPAGETPVINGDLTLCAGDMNTLAVASANTRYGIKVLNVSSEFGDPDFGSKQVLGIPDVYPGYGSVEGQWVGSNPDDPREYIEIEFANPSPINFIDIYETLNPGAVDTVYVKNPGTGNFEMVYSGTASPGQEIGTKNHITFPLTSFDVSEIRIAMASASVMGYNGIDAVGIGEEVPATFTAYAWSTGDSGSSISVGSAGTYAVTTTDVGGCVSSTSVVVTSPSQVTPSITVLGGGSVSFCEGASIVLSSDQQTNIVWSTGETTPNITVSTSGAYTVDYDDGSGCGVNTSNTIVVTVNPLPTVNIAGELAICDGGSTTLDAGTGFLSYMWSNGSFTQTINVNTIDEFTVFVTDNNGCMNSGSVTTTVGTPPSPVITGNLGFCQGASTTLDAGAGFASYSWSTGGTSQSITAATADIYSVTVTTNSGCTGSTSAVIVENPLPTPAITGDDGFCPGETAILDAGDGYASYNWFNGANAQSVTVNAAGTYGVTVTDGNGCTGSDSQTITAFTPPMPPIISGGLTFCGGNTTVLDAGENLSSYLWSTGETTNTIVVSTVGTFSVTVTDNNGCTGMDQVTTSLDGELPPIPGPVSGPSTGLCGGSNLVYSIDPVLNTDFYVWTVPDGMTITSGQGTTSITVDAIPNFTSGIIVPKANNACGQSPTFGQSFLLVQGYPDVPDTPQGPINIGCISENTYMIDPIPGVDSYNWTVPPGAIIAQGQGTNLIKVKFFAFSGSGDICVDVTNSCGVSLCCSDNCLTITCSDIENYSQQEGNQSETLPDEASKDILELTDDFGIYPNPSNGQFRLDGNIKAEGSFEMMVFSTLGDVVHYENRGQRTSGPLNEVVSLRDLSSGTYIIKVKVGQTVWNKKVVIIR